MLKRKYLSLFAILLLSLALVVSGCGGNDETASEDAGDKYPERALEVIVGWGAGGGTDVFARSISKPASEVIGQSMPVKNMEGSSGAIAGDFITQQPADGYTVWGMGVNYAINVALGRTPHAVDSYIPVVRIQHDTALLHVGKDVPYQTIQELVEYIKANPGKVKIGGTGAASFDEVVLALWKDMEGLDFIYVPYEKGGAMHSALLGGHIDVMFEEMGPVSALVDNDSITPVLLFAQDRAKKLPDVPSSVELGWDLTLGNWRGIMVKKDTPDNVVNKLEEAFTAAKDDADYLKYEGESFLDLRPGYLNSADFKVFMEKEIEIYTEALKKLGHI